MTSEVVAAIEEEAAGLRAAGRVPAGLEEELDARFADAARAELEPGSSHDEHLASASRTAAAGRAAVPANLAKLGKHVTKLGRQRFGPALRGLERRAVLGAGRAGEAASTQAHVAVDHLERVIRVSPLASRAVSAARPGGPPLPTTPVIRPAVEGALFEWVVERLGAAGGLEEGGEAIGPVLHVECGDGQLVEALVARGFDAAGADPRRSSRVSGGTHIVAAGALECLGASPANSLAGLLLTGVVDSLRPGAARALAHLAGSRLVPGGVVVLVSTRPEAANAVDPVVADLTPGRPLHPVTWCHLLARYGFSELAVFEPNEAEPDVFAVSARRSARSWPEDDTVR